MFVSYQWADVFPVMHSVHRKIAPVIAHKKRMNGVGIVLLVMPMDIHITSVKKNLAEPDIRQVLKVVPAVLHTNMKKMPAENMYIPVIRNAVNAPRLMGAPMVLNCHRYVSNPVLNLSKHKIIRALKFVMPAWMTTVMEARENIVAGAVVAKVVRQVLFELKAESGTLQPPAQNMVQHVINVATMFVQEAHRK